MVRYFKQLYDGFLKASLGKRVLYGGLILLYIVIFLSAVIKINVVVITPGVLNTTVYTNADESKQGTVKIDTNNKSANIFTIGVYTHTKVSLFQYLISQLSHEIDNIPFHPDTDLSEKDEILSGEIHREFGMTNSLIAAYEEAGKVDPDIHIEYEYRGLIVAAVLPDSTTGLQIRDIITHLNGIKITSLNDFKAKGRNLPEGMPYKLTIKRGEEEKTISVRGNLRARDVHNYFDYYIIDMDKTFPKYIISAEIKSLGSSGGAMTAFAIYNALLAGNIAGTDMITGTGTVDVNGNIGEIGAVEQKIITAKMYNADVFFVDKDDYAAALGKYEEIGAQFELVMVEKLADIVAYFISEEQQ